LPADFKFFLYQWQVTRGHILLKTTRSDRIYNFHKVKV